MVFRVNERLRLRDRRIEFDPPTARAHPEPLARDALADEPLRHAPDRLRAGRERVHDVRGREVLPVARRRGVRDGHQHVLEPVQVLLREPDAQREHRVQGRAPRAHPVERLCGAPLVHDEIGAACGERGRERREGQGPEGGEAHWGGRVRETRS